MQMQTQYQIEGVAPDPRFVAHFEWSEQDPAAIRVTFHEPSTTRVVEWVLSRELLLDGITSIFKVGIGDISIQSYGQNQFKIFLSSPEGKAEITILSQPVMNYLQATERVVPSALLEGSAEESKIISQLDSAIDAILSQAGRED